MFLYDGDHTVSRVEFFNFLQKRPSISDTRVSCWQTISRTSSWWTVPLTTAWRRSWYDIWIPLRQPRPNRTGRHSPSSHSGGTRKGQAHERDGVQSINFFCFRIPINAFIKRKKERRKRAKKKTIIFHIYWMWHIMFHITLSMSYIVVAKNLSQLNCRKIVCASYPS